MSQLDKTDQTTEQVGSWDWWREKRDKIVTPEVVQKMWYNLASQPNGLVPPPYENLMFLSPAAHDANNELIIFNEDSKTRKGVATFIVGDRENLKTPKGRLMQYGKSTLDYVVQDAESLINKTKPGSVDIFWDSYGYIWDYMKERDAKTEKFLEMMRGIHTVLKPGGCLVLDHMPDTAPVRKFSGEEQKRFPHLKGLELEKHSPSTYDAIDLQPPRGTMWALLEKDMFEPHITVGSGITQLLVLRKRK